VSAGTLPPSVGPSVSRGTRSTSGTSLIAPGEILPAGGPRCALTLFPASRGISFAAPLPTRALETGEAANQSGPRGYKLQLCRNAHWTEASRPRGRWGKARASIQALGRLLLRPGWSQTEGADIRSACDGLMAIAARLRRCSRRSLARSPAAWKLATSSPLVGQAIACRSDVSPR